jgi:hypothetical protein
MQRSIRLGSIRLGFAFLVLGALALTAAGCESQVGRANQSASSAVAAPGANAGTIAMDCEQLAKLSMTAEVHAMGVQFSVQSSPANLNQNIQELQRSVAQIQAMPTQHPQIEKLRNQYVALLQSLTQTAQQSIRPTSSAVKSNLGQVVNDQAKQAAKLRRDRIFFASCKA